MATKLLQCISFLLFISKKENSKLNNMVFVDFALLYNMDLKLHFFMNNVIFNTVS